MIDPLALETALSDELSKQLTDWTVKPTEFEPQVAPKTAVVSFEGVSIENYMSGDDPRRSVRNDALLEATFEVKFISDRQAPRTYLSQLPRQIVAACDKLSEGEQEWLLTDLTPKDQDPDAESPTTEITAEISYRTIAEE